MGSHSPFLVYYKNISVMNNKGEQTVKKGSASVTLLDDRTVVCRLSGEITGAIVKESMRQTRLLAEQIQMHSQPRLLLDISKITKQTSEARNRAKELRTVGFERIAICGGKRSVVMVGRYLVRITSIGGYTKFFKTEKRAVHWLERGDIQVDDNQLSKRAVTAVLVLLTAVGALIGWQLGVSPLTSIIPAAKPMNPMTALTFLPLALTIILMRKDWQRSAWRQRVALFTASWCLLFGAIVLLNFLFNTGVGIDSWLFVDKLNSGNFTGVTSPASALSFMCLGSILFCLLSGQERPWQQTLLFILSGVVFLQAISILIAFCFGFEKIYTFDDYPPMPINTAIACLLVNNIFATLSRSSGISARAIKGFYANWQALVVGLLLVLITGVAWQQSIHDVEENINTVAREAYTKADSNIQGRLTTYIDALNGYKGLFSASSDVAPNEFHNYFANSGLSTNYPGFTIFSYAAVVPEGSKKTFIQQTQARASADYPKFAQYTLYPANTNSIHYPLLYIEPNDANTAGYGFDLSSETIRKETLEKARDIGQPQASGIINLNVSSQDKNAPDNFGFFIGLPIYQATGKGDTVPISLQERRKLIKGFVIAYFVNNRLFGDLFANVENKDAQFAVVDQATGKEVYSTKADNVPADAPIKQSSIFEVAGKQWRLDMTVSNTYGKSDLYKFLPSGILVVGLAVSLLAGLLIFGQLRRRDQALQLAADMTEDLSAERNLAVANQRKDEAVLSSIGDAVFAINTKGRISLFNQACETISGYTAKEALGKMYGSILRFEYEKDGRINDSFIREALDGHISSMKNHTVLVRKDGKRVAVADSAAPIRDARGTLMGVIVVFRDVSKEQELDRAKTEFVSLASHQLRTPLSAINWYGELLLSGDSGKLSKAQHEYIQEIYDGNQRMIELVNSLLDVSRLDLGKLTNQPTPTSMQELAESVEKELRTSIESKKLKYVKQIASSLPKIIADPKLLRMIVQNLLSNAIKYTSNEGSVHVTMRKAADSELRDAKLDIDGDYFFMSVADTGYGIPKTQQSKIFSKLFRADNVRALDVEGTGLGLYIVKEVVAKLGGRVWFTSIESVGSTFYVILPFKTKTASSTEKAVGPRKPQIKT